MWNLIKAIIPNFRSEKERMDYETERMSPLDWEFESPIDIEANETYELIIDPLTGKPLALRHDGKIHELKVIDD